ADGGWVYGSPHRAKEGGHVILFDKGSPSTMDFDWVYVDSDTVGQYTGLKDKNGTRIFEGDIVKLCRIRVYPVIWKNSAFQVNNDFLGLWPSSDIEVIGNIHDNPELLEHHGW
ncbi:MAG: YopX family protein, partial [Treponema sp.]|nr:YopX family protein [Treponema sp.]